MGLFNKFKPNCMICILRVIDTEFEVLLTPGKLILDQVTQSVRLISKQYEVNESAIPYKFFKKYGSTRIIFLFSPSPTEFRPVEYEYMLNIKNKPVVRSFGEDDCLMCLHEKTDKEQTFEKYIENKERVPLCSKHMTQLSKIRFKVISDDRKELYGLRLQERIRRSLSQNKKWYEQPWVQLVTIIVAAGIMFAIIIKYGGDMNKEALQASVEAFKQLTAGVPK